jgi:fluoride exporter
VLTDFMNLQTVLMVGAAGFFGTIARYLTAQMILAHSIVPGLATFTVNLLGSFAIGLVYGLAASRLSVNGTAVITVGFLGGFTTYSAFSAETIAFIRDGRLAYAGGYVVAMVILCLVATYLGVLLAQVANR